MKGHPILGVISGFFFGLFLAATLFLYGVVSLDSNLLPILPLAGIVVGLVLAWLAPFGSGGQMPQPSEVDTAQSEAGTDEPPAEPTSEPSGEPTPEPEVESADESGSDAEPSGP